jgi:hypothetical protein
LSLVILVYDDSLGDLSPQRFVKKIESSTIVLHQHPPQRQGFAKCKCKQNQKVVFILCGDYPQT